MVVGFDQIQNLAERQNARQIGFWLPFDFLAQMLGCLEAKSGRMSRSVTPSKNRSVERDQPGQFVLNGDFKV